jgi:hypothetical protein
MTDAVQSKRLGPKSAMKLRKFFSLTMEDDVSGPLEASRCVYILRLCNRYESSSSGARFNPTARARSRTERRPRSCA